MLYLNTLPTRSYSNILHLDTEADCFDRLPADTSFVGSVEELANLGESPKHIAFLMKPYDTLRGFKAFIAALADVFHRKGIEADEVLVVTDCWGGQDNDCRNQKIDDVDWSELEDAPFDVSLWSGEVCPIAHELVAVMQRG